MKLIAHRGLISGPNPALENSPDNILKVVSMGYDCEIDLWKKGDYFFLGHDYAQYEIAPSFLDSNHLWVHAKNLEAITWLLTSSPKCEFFWHEGDTYTLTSGGWLWSYPGAEMNAKTICVMPEHAITHQPLCDLQKCFGVCSDFIESIEKNLNKLY